MKDNFENGDAERFPSFGGVDAQADGVVRNSKSYHLLPYNHDLKAYAAKLRKAGNLCEVLLWQQIKNRQFKNFDFDRQKLIGNYIVDFYCANSGVVIEIDGESHNEKTGYDTERDVFLEGLGLTVIHLLNKDMKKNLQGVMEFLRNHHPALTGTPPREGNLGDKLYNYSIKLKDS
jgi:very-short-patch-repair endonuclease